MTPIELIRECLKVLEENDMRVLGITIPLCQMGLAKPDYCVAIVEGPHEGEVKVISIDSEGCDDLISGENITMQWGDFLLFATLGAEVNNFDITQHVKGA